MFSAKTLAIHLFRDINSKQVNVNRLIDKFRRIVLLSKRNIEPLWKQFISEAGSIKQSSLLKNVFSRFLDMFTL